MLMTFYNWDNADNVKLFLQMASRADNSNNAWNVNYNANVNNNNVNNSNNNGVRPVITVLKTNLS